MLTIPIKTLSEAYSLCDSIAAKRSPKPILQNVLLSGGTLRATNLEQSIAVKLDCEDLDVLLPPAFGAILKEAREDVTLSVEGSVNETLLVTSGKSTYKLPTGNPAEYPASKQPEFAAAAVVPGMALRTLLSRTAYACDCESTRYAMGGVLFQTDKDRLLAVATDGRRMAVSEAACTGEIPTPGVVPLAACKLLLRGLPDDESATVCLTENSLYVQCGRVTLESRLVEGRFPRWQDVFPKGAESSVDIPAGILHAAVRQAAIATTTESVAVRFEFEAGLLRLSARSSEVGTSKVELPIALTGPDVSVSLDPSFVGDALKVLDPQASVTLLLKDSQSAVVLEAEGTRCVVMPLGDK